MAVVRDHRGEHERFATALAKGSEQGEAYRIAFPGSKANANTVRKEAHLLAKTPEIVARVAELRARAMVRNELSVERTLREVGSILHNDPRRFFREDGSGKPPHEWDDEMAMAVSSIEMVPVVLPGTVDETQPPDAKGKPQPRIGHAYKVKFWSKIDAADKIMRHQGLFEKDNKQRQDNLALQINLVGAEPPGDVVVQATLVDGRNR